jgi:hypothetical protein
MKMIVEHYTMNGYNPKRYRKLNKHKAIIKYLCTRRRNVWKEMVQNCSKIGEESNEHLNS